MSGDADGFSGLDRAQAAVIVPGAIAVCSGISGFFVAYVAASALSRVPRPLAEHLDAATSITAVLFGALFAICLRAHLRVRRRGATQGEVLIFVVRAVPYLMAAAAAGGALFGARAAREAALRDDARARATCEQVLGAGSSEIEACLAAGIRCLRSSVRRVTLGESAEAGCVREAMGKPAR